MAERSYPHFAFCAPPGVAHKWTATDTIGGIFTVLLAGGALSLVLDGLIAAIFGGGIGVSCVVTMGLIWAGILAVDAFDDWYYHSRLMCIKEKQCTIGTLCGVPYVSADDGDQKYDVLLAPFGIAEVEQLFRDVIAEHPEQYGVGPTDPGSQALGLYIAGYLTERERISLYMRVVREKMITQAGRDFQKRTPTTATRARPTSVSPIPPSTATARRSSSAMSSSSTATGSTIRSTTGTWSCIRCAPST